MTEVFQFIKYQTRRLWCSPRPYIVLFAVFAGFKLCFGASRIYLLEISQTIQAAEFFIFATTNRIPQWILVLGMLLLLGDAPFLRTGLELYILRSSRNRWLMGQVLFCITTIFVYLIVITGMLLFIFRGCLSFTNEWSEAIILSCQLNSGQWMNISTTMQFPIQIITSGSPYGIFVVSFLYTMLLMILCNFLCIVCNLKFRTGVSCFVIVFLLVWRFFLDVTCGPLFFYYISPCTLATIGSKSLNHFNICYTILFFLCTCSFLYLYTYNIIQKTDLQRGVAV